VGGQKEKQKEDQSETVIYELSLRMRRVIHDMYVDERREEENSRCV
jgi:hypothetical protein